MFLSVPTSSLFLTPTWVRYLCQHAAEAVRPTSMHYSNLGCLCKKKANQGGVPATLATPGARVVLSSRGREGSLTGCSLRVVAHEALPRSCCFTEAKHVEEPHLFQMQLNLVQILFQEHKAQRTWVCLPAPQHSETGRMGCGHRTARAQMQCLWQEGSIEKTSHLRKEQPVQSIPREFLLLNTEGGQHGPQGCSMRECQVAQNFHASNHSSRISKKLGYSSGNAVETNASGDLSFIYTLHGTENQLSISKKLLLLGWLHRGLMEMCRGVFNPLALGSSPVLVSYFILKLDVNFAFSSL